MELLIKLQVTFNRTCTTYSFHSQKLTVMFIRCTAELNARTLKKQKQNAYEERHTPVRNYLQNLMGYNMRLF